MLRHFRFLNFLIFLTGITCNAATALATGDPDVVYYSAEDFSVTDFDLKMYLRKAPEPPEGTVGSRARNLQALSDLYAMQVLLTDANETGLINEAERNWIANYAVAIETINRYLREKVSARLAETDWEAEALEQYLGNPERYEIPESVSLRTLLIRTDERTEADALELAAELLEEAKGPDADFAELVRTHTDDEVAAKSGGFMKIKRGETVEPFEDAAFALTRPGQLSEPVISQFGVHLIQFLEYQPARTLTFEQAREQIIAELTPVRAAQYREAIQAEARARKPEGFVEHTEALDALMLQTSDGPLGIN